MNELTVKPAFDPSAAKRREERGIVIAAMCKLHNQNGIWAVPSQSGGTKRYSVNPTCGTCDCPDFKEWGYKCKHLYAVEITVRRECNSDGTITETRSVTFTEKKTYKQNWPAYREVQINEKPRFRTLLHELCKGIPEPPLPKTGRHPVPLSDRLFSVCYKIYGGFSSHRFGGDLNDAVKLGFISRTIHPNKTNCFLESPSLTAPLKTLIVQTSLPLKSLESVFAADSTGFSTARHVRWFDEKYGTERSGRDWVKVHIASGVKTNVVTAAAIYGRDANDCPILPELVKKTKENFNIKDFCADKAYLSVENIEEVFAAGGTPLIPFKSNSTGGMGGLFERMFHFYQFRHSEFMERYHQRSNVETTVHMVKAKFGTYVRSRTDVALMNEVFGKLVCHNICCLIQSQCELGIEPVFWSDGERPILPLTAAI
jgi:transposase